ncbi:MAG: adenylate/guanylate cyclase domain-containing protein, partial [Gaiellaceae bacterium]
MEPESSFTRRVSAVLLADVTGFSRLMGEDDERTAHAVHRFQALAKGVVAEATGQAEAVAGDALFATFESVVAAVNAALTIQERLAEDDSAGTPLQVRMGVHVGDVLLREGRAFGDAINIAARLQALARPGTVCISDTVYRQVRNKFDVQFVDLGVQRLKNISDPVHAYLIVPHHAQAAPRSAARRSVQRWAIAAGAVVALAGGALVMVRYRADAPVTAPRHTAMPTAASEEEMDPGAAQQEAAPIALGVMLFKTPGGDAESDWRREALRDGLNTQLSQLSRVKVYSKEFIDFLITRKGLTEIEAATQLGIKKMLSGSFVKVGDTLRIETHVVDVSTGVLETSYTTTGKDSQFIDLQSNLTMGVIARLNLPVTDAEKQALLARRNTNEDALKLLLEAETGGAPRPSSGGKPAAQAPRSALPQWLAALLPAIAYAEDGSAEAAIPALLERYRKATEARQLDALAALHTQFTDEQRAAQQRYFENVRDLKVVIENVDVAVVGDEAVVSYTRTDDFADAKT